MPEGTGASGGLLNQFVEDILFGYRVGKKGRIVSSPGFGSASSAAPLRYSRVCKLTKEPASCAPLYL